MNVYITKQGDSWDFLAHYFYGSEYLMTDLVEANQQYRHYIDFPEGIELVIPEVEIDEDAELPEWLINDEDANEEEPEENPDESEGIDDGDYNEIN